MKKTPEDIQQLLMEVVTHFDKEDVSIRERQIRTWRRLKLLWEGFQKAWYSEVAHDWRIWDEANEDDSEQSYYDKPVNVFRAYLESIIAALSVTVPPVKCYPDNADDTLDLSTAKAGDKIAQLIFRHNDAPLLWVHALFIFCTEGMVACYSYAKKDEKYGTYKKKIYEDETEEHEYVRCPNCGYDIEDQVMDPEMIAIQEKLELQKDKFDPGAQDVEIQATIDEGTEICPECLETIIPEIVREPLVIPRLVGETNEPKSRVVMEAYGGLWVKVPNYAQCQADCPYLIYSYETNTSVAIERFEHLHGMLADKLRQSTGPKDPYEEWGRLNPQYQGEYPTNVVTVRNAWLRPAAFNILNDKGDVKRLKELYPNGARVVLVNDLFGEAENECLDDSWTITKNPLSDYIHFDPLGMLLVPLQEITNDLVSLTLQTIEHGIPQTFADPGVLNFNAYRQMESTPGGIYEATPKSGKTVGEAFHEVKTASLSPEVMPFSQSVQSMAQLVSGALPSLFGGQLAGSETASEYSMSRAQALQRLQNTWKMLTYWWKDIFGKVIPMYMKEVQEDERDVQQNSDGSFVNTFIRKAEIEGKIGKVELEANENLPLTWSQQKDVIMKLLENSSPEVLKIIAAPENLQQIREAIGLTDFYVPGEDDVIKQYDEIKLLLSSEPIENPQMNMQPMEGEELPPEEMQPEMPEMPSVDIDPIYDNHQIEFEIVRKWVVSEAGRLAKTENEAGYRNVLLHGTLHFEVIQQQMMEQQMAAQGAGAAPGEKPNKDLKAPIQGESDVATQ